jgi:hypothetical protein
MTQFLTISKIQNNAVADMHTLSSDNFNSENDFVVAAENKMISLCRQYDDDFDTSDEDLVSSILEDGFYEFNDDGTLTTVCLTWS